MITAFINLKGGSTKSSSAVHLCRYLRGKNKSVALVGGNIGFVRPEAARY